MTPSGPHGPALATDFELMVSVADKTDLRNDEIRAMLAQFIGAMSSVPPSVWAGRGGALPGGDGAVERGVGETPFRSAAHRPDHP